MRLKSIRLLSEESWKFERIYLSITSNAGAASIAAADEKSSWEIKISERVLDEIDSMKGSLLIEIF